MVAFEHNGRHERCRVLASQAGTPCFLLMRCAWIMQRSDVDTSAADVDTSAAHALVTAYSDETYRPALTQSGQLLRCQALLQARHTQVAGLALSKRGQQLEACSWKHASVWNRTPSRSSDAKRVPKVAEMSAKILHDRSNEPVPLVAFRASPWPIAHPNPSLRASSISVHASRKPVQIDHIIAEKCICNGCIPRGWMQVQYRAIGNAGTRCMSNQARRRRWHTCERTQDEEIQLRRPRVSSSCC